MVVDEDVLEGDDVSFHADDFASAGADQTIRVWDLATQRVMTSFVGHRGEVNALCALDIAGRPVVASAGADHMVRLWDLVTDRPVLEIDVGAPALSLTEVAPGHLVVGTLDGLQALTVR